MLGGTARNEQRKHPRAGSRFRYLMAAALMTALPLLAPADPAWARPIADPDPTEDGGGGGTGGHVYIHPANGFSWNAANRFNGWDDAWRSREQIKAWASETYKPSYVNPDSWNISVMGCQSENDYLSNIDPKGYEQLQEEEPDKYPDQTTLYRWQWNGNNSGFKKSCTGVLDFPKEGIHFVTLTARYADNTEETWQLPVEVKDFLVVVIGDSSASGEGSPDIKLDDSTTGRAEWIDNRCHRSNNAGGAQAAKRLEGGDPHSSVTFLSFACSGATLATDSYDGEVLDPYEDEEDYDLRGSGVTGPYAGIEPTKFIGADEADFRDKLPSQVDQLWNALTDFGAHQPRKIDVLIIAGGINDARFADLAATCVMFWGCHLDAQIVGETPGTQRSLDDQFHHDANNIPMGFEILKNQLAASRPLDDGTMSLPIEAEKKLALTYPPFFRDDEGDQCTFVLNDGIPDGFVALYFFITPFPLNLVPPGFTTDEIDHAESVWAPYLNAKVAQGADLAGFELIDTIPNRFDRHGICADDAYINTPTVSKETQGNADGQAGALAKLSSKGTAHPNTKGYSAYADEILRHLGHLTEKEGNLPPVAVADKMSASKFAGGSINVLANDTDADPADVLAARLATSPQHGEVTVQLDGTAKYSPSRGYVGEDSFLYEVTDGQDSRFATVDVTVRAPIRLNTTVVAGEMTEIGGFAGTVFLDPPYRLAFDQPLVPAQGSTRFQAEDGTLFFTPPPLGRGRIRLDYTLFSDTTDRTSPSYGESVRGRLIVRVKRPR